MFENVERHRSRISINRSLLELINSKVGSGAHGRL